MKKKSRPKSIITCKLEISTNTDDPEPPSENLMKCWAETCLNHLLEKNADIPPRDVKIANLSIYITNLDEARFYNNKYRQKNRATNVLSFTTDPLLIDGILYLGDILCCSPVIHEEAIAQNKPIMNHWAHMIIHSLLHLCGFDHQTEQEAAEMEALEIDILKELGVSNPYIINTKAEAYQQDQPNQPKPLSQPQLTIKEPLA